MDREGGKDTTNKPNVIPQDSFPYAQIWHSPFSNYPCNYSQIPTSEEHGSNSSSITSQHRIHLDSARAWIYRGTGYRLPISIAVFIPAEPFRFVRGAGNSKSGFPEKKFI